MATLDELIASLGTGNEDNQPGGSQEKFIMNLLGNAAQQKGYQSLQLPALTLLLGDQLRGFDTQRAKQAELAQALKTFQMKRLQTQATHEDQKMAREQELAGLQRNLPAALAAPVQVPGYEDQAQGMSVAPTTRPQTPIEQAGTLAQAHPTQGAGLLEALLKPKPPVTPPRPVYSTQGGEAVDARFNPATNSWEETRRPLAEAPARQETPEQRDERLSRISLNNARAKMAGQGEKPLSPKDKQTILNQIRGEARRQVEAQFRGMLGQLDLSSLGKTPEERNVKFKALIDGTVGELAQERGFSLEELGASGKGITKESPSSPVVGMPPANKHPGKTIRDTETDKRYKSVDGQWVLQHEGGAY